MHASVFGRCVVVWFICVASARRVDVGAGPHQQVARAWVFGWVALLMGACIDCWHMHTDFDEVTDTGLKAFSAALSSNTDITTVKLKGTSAWRVRVSGSMCRCACGCVRSCGGV